MRIVKALAVISAALYLTGCSTTLARDINAEASSVKVEVKHVVDPVGYSQGNTVYYPPAGHRFIGAVVGIKNKTKREKKIYLDKFVMAYRKKVGGGPSLIDMNALIAIQANPRPVLAADEYITRNLIYAFPMDYTPDRMFIPEVGEVRFPKSAKK